VEPDEMNLNFLKEIVQTDQRIKIFKNDNKLGVASSRNRAITQSNGQFIAIIDGDDYCDIKRFEKQLGFLKENPHIGIVGSNMYLVDGNNNIVGERKYPELHEDIKKHFLLTMSIANPTVMIRRKDLGGTGLFDTKFSKAEDFELWLRFLALNKQMHNLQENLVYYRIQTTHNEKRGAIHWKNNYSARKRYSKFIWNFYERCPSLIFFYIMHHTPKYFLDNLLDLKIVDKIKNIKIQ
jgi:glycosyltransferase involved in cell wall biosynthesis